jgi:hypothetical protein
MCMSCGCGKPNEDHGNPDHITLDMIQRAAKAADIDLEHAADNIHNSARELGSQGAGSSLRDNTGDSSGDLSGGSMSSHGGSSGSGSSTVGEGTRQDHGIRS